MKSPINDTFQNLILKAKDKNSVDYKELAQMLGISYISLYTIRQNPEEKINPQIINKLSALLDKTPIDLKYELDSSRRFLSLFSGVTEASLYRLCELYMSGMKIIKNSYFSSKILKPISVAGIAYRSNGSRKATVVEDWNELKKSYLLSTFSAIEYLKNPKHFLDYYSSIHNLNYKVLLYGISNCFMEPLSTQFNKSLFSIPKETKMIKKRTINNLHSKQFVNKNYTYELIFTNQKEKEDVESTFDNLNGLDIRFIYVPTTVNFNYVDKYTYFELSFLLNILVANHLYQQPHSYLFLKKNNETEYIESLWEHTLEKEKNNINSISVNFYDSFLRATLSAIILCDHIYYQYRDYPTVKALNRMAPLDLLMLSISHQSFNDNQWKAQISKFIKDLKPSFTSFLIITTCLCSLLENLDATNSQRIVNLLNDFLFYFKSCSTRNEFLSIIFDDITGTRTMPICKKGDESIAESSLRYSDLARKNIKNEYEYWQNLRIFIEQPV